MSHYLIELLVWVVLAYAFGCLIGWFAKNVFGAAPAGTAMQPEPMVAKPVMQAPAAPLVHKPAPAAPAIGSGAAAAMQRPKGISAARGGKPDDLKRISGIGPKNEDILHSLGIYHFDQIAAWSPKEVAWVDDHLSFGGRIQREEWIRQASLLAEGKEEQFMKEFGTGGLKGKDGQTQSGTHTRKN